MKIAGQLLLCDEESDRVCLRPGTLTVNGGKITNVQSGVLDDTAEFGGSDCLISPGFIDTHLHLPQFGIVGAHGMPLLGWLNEVTFPAEAAWRDADHAANVTEHVIDQLYAHGTTAVAAYTTVHGESTIAAMEVASRRGLAGVIGQTLMDCQAPSELTRKVDDQLHETDQLLRQFPPGADAPPRLAAAVTPRFAVSCSRELLRGAGELTAQHGAVVQTHLAETLAECAFVGELFDGASYVDVYRQAGLLTERSILGHGIHLDKDDLKKIAEAGSTIAHCPTANSFLRSGAMPRAKWLSSGVSVSLGSDIGAGYERSMVRVGRAMIETASMVGAEIPSAAQAWWQITHGNGKAIGWSDRNRIHVGADADILVIRPNIDWQDGPVDPLSRLMFAWDDRWIERTIVMGREVISEC